MRLNRDQLGEYCIEFDPTVPCITVKIENLEYLITEDHLSSIYYRAPTFLRDIVQENLSPEEQLYRTQWAAFVRSLIVFENVKWINNPVDTYKAEIKPIQLLYAKKVGFNLPRTVISNYTKTPYNEKVAIKSIDTAIISDQEQEAFVYTTILNGEDLENATYSSPFFIQQALTPKIDLRVTVIDSDVVAASLTSLSGIDDDWRKYPGEIIYQIHALPENIKDMCVVYTRLFNLNFSAIDLVIFDNDYYFIEINPTGEWAWLQKNTGFEYDTLIVKSLCNGNFRR